MFTAWKVAIQITIGLELLSRKGLKNSGRHCSDIESVRWEIIEIFRCPETYLVGDKIIAPRKYS
jgi:hypothetical protein